MNAFAGGIVAALMACPQSVFAQCTVTPGGTINCAVNTATTPGTTNINGANPSSSDATQIFNNGSPINATITSGTTISGGGLNLVVTTASGIGVINNGSLTTAQSPALVINGNGGAITYSGNGSITNPTGANDGLTILNSGAGTVDVGTAATPVTPTISGGIGLAVNTVNANQTINVSGGSVTTTAPAASSIGGIAVNLVVAGTGNSTAAFTGGSSIVNASGLTNTVGIQALAASSGIISITSDATIGSAASPFFLGINAQATSGNIAITQSGAVFSTSNSVMAQTTAGGAVTVTAPGPLTSINGPAIFAEQLGGNGNVQVTSGVVNGGITAQVSGTGTGKVDATGAVTGATGISMIGQQGAVSVTAAAAVTGVSADGIDALTTKGGAVTVTSNGPVTASGGTGILAQQAGGDGNVQVTTGNIVSAVQGINAHAEGAGSATVDTRAGTVTGTGADGITVTAAAGPVLVETGAVSGGNNGINASTGNGGAVTVTTAGAVTGGSPGSGIAAVQANGNGNVQVTTGAAVSGSAGIIAAASGTGAVTVTAASSVTGTGAGGQSGFGINAGGVDGLVTVNVNNSGTVVTGTGAGVAGILAATSGGGNIAVNLAAGTAVTNATGRGLDIRQTGTVAGVYTVGNAGTVTGAGTAADPVINVLTTNGATTLTNKAGGSIASVAGLPGDLALAAAGGSINLDNFGTLIGRVDLAAASSASVRNSNLWNVAGSNLFPDGALVTNGAGGIINAGTSPGAVAGATSFSGSGVLNVVNAGTINVLAGAAQGGPGGLAFSGKAGSNFNNGGGFIDLRADGGTPMGALTLNATALTGTSNLNYAYSFANGAFNFQGGANSRLAVDATLGGPGSSADRLVVGGNLSGTTQILINDAAKGAAAAANPAGITIVATNGTSSGTNFTLSPSNPNFVNTGPLGALRKGGVLYELLYVPSSAANGVNQYELVGVPDMGMKAFALNLAISHTAAQNIWDETALGWQDRQDELRGYHEHGIIAASRSAAGGPYASMAMPVNAVPPNQDADQDAGHSGMWIKSIGNWTRRDSSIGTPGGGATFDTGYRQSIGAVIGGLDIGKSEVFSPVDAFSGGIMGGYISSAVNFNPNTMAGAGTQSAKLNYAGGTVGVSASYMRGGFFVDTLVKADLLTLGISGLPQGLGMNLADLNATTWGVLSNAGWRFDFHRWFVEPVATASFVQSHIDDLMLPVASTVVQFGRGESLRGAVGARFGGVLTDDKVHLLEASLTARVWNEFRGENNVSVLNAANILTTGDTFTRPFGELALQLDWHNRFSGWEAFAKASVKFNDELVNASAKGGVRYQW